MYVCTKRGHSWGFYRVKPELDDRGVVKLVNLATQWNQPMAVLNLLHLFLTWRFWTDVSQHGLGKVQRIERGKKKQKGLLLHTIYIAWFLTQNCVQLFQTLQSNTECQGRWYIHYELGIDESTGNGRAEKKERVWECVCQRRKKKKGMKMPSAMGYLETSLIQEWGSLSRKWKNMAHSWTLWQNCIATTFFAVKAVWSNFAAVQSYKLHTVNLNAIKNSLFHSLCYAQDLILAQAFLCCNRDKCLQLQCLLSRRAFK